MTAPLPTTSLSGADWFKSSYSNAANNCVEAAYVSGGLAIRDSKDISRAPLSYGTSQWTAFCEGVVSGAL
ncbi:DUF397 domain-containing protein [Streptomyces sp. SID11233]|uniref:DUF397 domain-containing protein n=1 Tax=Streptomyces sp. SID11385 TaxID=2706031 RepID=UPI0013C09722|nr:DUF397 domain-containing protein [Streptomyces sp. SID11385]NED82438.1 DUF397 domain-containing protein [Streptomyces sp. SID11233]